MTVSEEEVWVSFAPGGSFMPWLSQRPTPLLPQASQLGAVTGEVVRDGPHLAKPLRRREQLIESLLRASAHAERMPVESSRQVGPG